MKKNTPGRTLIRPLQSFLIYLCIFLCALTSMVKINAADLLRQESAEEKEKRLKWFKEARFGMFIHWGVYAVPAGKWKGKETPWGGEWIQCLEKIPLKEYRALGKDFTASKYDPEFWARLAKEAGMKYVVITAKHHDGFALFDTQASDWNAVKSSGAGRDLIAPLAKAVRKEGLEFGVYYSHAQDWTNPGGAIFKLKLNDPGWDPAHAGNFDTYLREVAQPQVRELFTKYKPRIIWWDTAEWMTPERAKPFVSLLSLSPGIISNDRLLRGYEGDTMTPEQHIPPKGYPGKLFEVCMTMNGTWGYKSEDHQWKSVHDLIQKLSDISSKGGNFLLNVGPDREGVIPAESVERLQGMGKWMEKNGVAIYGTEGSPFPRRFSWGRTTQRIHPDGSNTLYLHLWESPASKKILLPTVQIRPKSLKWLQNGKSLVANLIPQGLEIEIPSELPDPSVSVAALDFDKPLKITMEEGILPAANGTIVLLPQDADTYGSLSGNLKLKGEGSETYLSNWISEEFSIEYPIQTQKTQKWQVTAEVAAAKALSLSMESGEDKVQSPIASTGGEEQWKKVDLGQVSLPQGLTRLVFKPVKNNWSSLNLKTITLTPVK